MYEQAQKDKKDISKKFVKWNSVDDSLNGHTKKQEGSLVFCGLFYPKQTNSYYKNLVFLQILVWANIFAIELDLVSQIIRD